MSNYNKFLIKFGETFEGNEVEDQIYKFIYKFDEKENPLNAELKEDNDDIQHDSYGNEDSILKRVFYFPEFDIFVEFSGTRQSYNGEEWTEMKEVKPVTKTIETYE